MLSGFNAPTLPVLFLTGEPIENVKDGLGRMTAYLRKPYDLADVATTIRELLNPAKVDGAEV